MYIARKRKAGRKREREREREKEKVAVLACKRASNPFITRTKWVLRNWACLHLLLSETVVQFRACPVHCQRSRIFQTPSSFKSVFFCKSSSKKVLPIQNAFYYCLPAALSVHTYLTRCSWRTCFLLFLSICFCHLSTAVFKQERALRKVGPFDVKLCEF